MSSETQLRRLGLFDARVPRYTSYPSANHFSPAVGPDDTARWIRAIPEGSAISLYVHIPFCRRLCWFCACRTQGTSTAAPVQTYLDVVARELRQIGDLLPEGVRLARLHWGGGTPTLLTPEMILDLAARITDVAPLADDAEFSVEIDPNEIDAPRLDALAAAGMNRASIGVQDFNPEIQETIGRPQTYALTKEAVDAIRDRGIRSLNIDLLYGLPYQTKARITDSVQKVLSLSPDRVALYGYAHVPWVARRQSLIPVEALPAPEDRLKLYETARRLFLWDGYEEIGIDHFARPTDGLARAARDGRLRRNFQGYTDDTSGVLIGVGASAISRYPQGYAQNDPSTSGYHGRVAAGDLATSRGHAFAGDDGLRGAIISELMCRFAVDFEALALREGLDAGAMRDLSRGVEEVFAGMVERTPQGIAILPDARPMTRMIARYFDGYAVASDAHSAAI